MTLISASFSASLRLGAILLVGGVVQAAEPIVWKWAEGDSARYQLTQTTKMTFDAGPAGKVANASRQETLLRWTVEGTPTDGRASLRQATERVVVEHTDSMGQGFAYDSADEDPPAGMAALVAPMFEAMIENDLMLAMAGTGEIAQVTMSDELAEAFDRLPGGAISAEKVTQMTKAAAVRFPNEPLAVGATWTNVAEIGSAPIDQAKVSTTYTYTGTREVDGRQLDVFTPAVTVEAVGEGLAEMITTVEVTGSEGELLFDRQAGRVYQSNVTHTMAIHAKLGDQAYVNELQQGIALRLLGKGEGLTLDEAAEDAAAEAERTK